jgi:hypothetical protein
LSSPLFSPLWLTRLSSWVVEPRYPNWRRPIFRRVSELFCLHSGLWFFRRNAKRIPAERQGRNRISP